MRTLLVCGVLALTVPVASSCNDNDLVTGSLPDTGPDGGAEGPPEADPDGDAGGEGDPTYDPGTDDGTDPGLDGGHFDLDTSSAFYEFDHGTTDHHVHEYDDAHDVLGVDFFDMLDEGFTRIASVMGPAQEFYVIVGNAQLSPMVALEINGTRHDAGAYQQRVVDFRNGAASLAPYSLGGSGARLESLRLVIDPDAIVSGGLVATSTGCVRRNDPGLYGEYRNGAFLVQLLDKSRATIDPVTNTATANGGLLWEASVFWHKPHADCL